jgi:hypothetical protein
LDQAVGVFGLVQCLNLGQHAVKSKGLLQALDLFNSLVLLIKLRKGLALHLFLFLRLPFYCFTVGQVISRAREFFGMMLEAASTSPDNVLVACPLIFLSLEPRNELLLLR